jgi:protein gp37
MTHKLSFAAGRYWDESHSVETGCTPIDDPADPCGQCWARQMVKLRRQVDGGNEFRPTWHSDRLGLPQWMTPHIVFWGLMGDWLHADVINRSHVLAQVSAMAAARQHVFLTSTKRPGRLASFWAFASRPTSEGGLNRISMPANIWLGTSVWNQNSLDRNLSQVCLVPGQRWISYESTLGPIPHLSPWLSQLSWVTLGAETGPKRREADPEWFRMVLDQCRAAGVPAWVKAFPLGGRRITHKLAEMPAWARVRQLPSDLARIVESRQ